MRFSRFVIYAVLFCAFVANPDPLWSQVSNGANNGPTVQLDLAAQADLKALVDLVSQRLGVGILYDEQLDNKRLTLRTPNEIPVRSLMNLLQTALRMKNLALVDADIPGWKKIVALGDFKASTRLAGSDDDESNTTPVTRTLVLQHANPQSIASLIGPFLTSTGPAGATSGARRAPGAASDIIINQNSLIVTDFPDNLARIQKLVNMLDVKQDDVTIEFVRLQHAKASELMQQIKDMTDAKMKMQQSLGSWSERDAVELAHDDRTNQVIVMGRKNMVDPLVETVRKFDISLPSETQTYTLEFANAKRVSQMLDQLIGETAKGQFRTAIEENRNMLLVTTGPELQKQIASLVKRVDVAPPKDQDFIRTFKLQNMAALELLSTLNALGNGANSEDELGSGAEFGFRGVSGMIRNGGGGFRRGGQRGSSSTMQSGTSRSRTTRSPSSRLSN